MRKTKIICTMGPACCNEQTLTEMCLAGMNVARLNFSHGTHESHKQTIDLIKKVRKKLKMPLAILLDTKGPEYRTGVFKNGSVTLNPGDKFTFTADDIIGDETRVSVSYKNLPNELQAGDTVLVNNGLTSFTVDEIKGSEIICTVVEGGTISDRKSMAFPNKVLNQPFLSEQDKEDLVFGIKNGIDFVAASFVSNMENVRDMRLFINEHGGENIDIVAKIENRSGVENINEICEHCEGIMVARGDLGVEIPFVILPEIQKSLITTCRMKGKRVITATEMLESMITNPRPTRAEISDVANSVYDGTSAVMLSGETAVGAHPVQVVKVMDAICLETEKSISYGDAFLRTDFEIKNQIDAVSRAACTMAASISAKAITVCTMSGKTARMVSRFRPSIDIVGLTTEEKSWHKLALSWGVKPVLSDSYNNVEVMFYEAARTTSKTLKLKKGDTVVVVGSTVSGQSGTANTIRLETLT